MSDTVVINNEFATLVYDSDKRIVHHTFHKPIGGDEFRAILNGGAELLEKHGAIKWLSDDRGNSALSKEDTEWSMSNWFPRAVKAGWKYWALVVPESVMARLNLTEFVDSYSAKGVRIMVFTDPVKGKEWLVRQ